MDMQISRQQAAGGASGQLTIDLGALRDNYLSLAALAPASQTAAVVKANAYGLGADIVSQTLFEAADVPRQVDRVPCGRVRRPHREHLLRRERVTRPPQADPGPGRGPQRLPEVRRTVGHRPASSLSTVASGSSAAIPPSSSSSPTRASQASNSGAGRSPSVRRNARTSWKDRLW